MGDRDDVPTKQVAFFVTDLPGGLDALRVSIRSASAGEGEFPLNVDTPLVELSSLHGPNQSQRVASGKVPVHVDGRVSLVFDGAEGLRAGEWSALEMPQNRINIEGALAPQGLGRSAVLFDFNLDASVVLHPDSKIVFQPYVQTTYYFGDNDSSQAATDIQWGSQQAQDTIVKVHVPSQFLDVRTRPTDAPPCPSPEACKRSPSANGQEGLLPPGTSTGSGMVGGEILPDDGGQSGGASDQNPWIPTIPPLPIGPRPDPTSSASPTTSGSPTAGPPASITNDPPAVPIEPFPPDTATAVTRPVTLTWTATDPNGDPMTYQVVVNNAVICTDAAATCSLVDLMPGTTYSWRVTAMESAVGGTGKVTVGPLWTFTTLNRPPELPSGPTPLHDKPDQPVPETGKIMLSWSGGDADGDEVRYRVYLGGTNPPPSVHCDWSTATTCETFPMGPGVWIYWRVEAMDPSGALVTGPIWKFKTEAPLVPTSTVNTNEFIQTDLPH